MNTFKMPEGKGSFTHPISSQRDFSLWRGRMEDYNLVSIIMNWNDCMEPDYSKLVLVSMYNLVHIQEGNEWNTAFSSVSGLYSTAPAVFQSFVNEVLYDMLHRYILAHIDDILIYTACRSHEFGVN